MPTFYIDSGSITGSLQGTASYAATASYVVTALTASYVTSSNIVGTVTSASYAQTASYVVTALTASYVTASNIVGTVTSSSYAATASYVVTALTASYVTALNIIGTVTSASYATTASYVVTALTASYVTSSNIVGTVTSASYSATASLASTATTANNVNVGTVGGNTDFYIPLVSSQGANSVNIYNSANSVFYNPSTNRLTVPYVSASQFTGALAGTASWASNALTASYITASAIVGTVTSASYAATASYVVTALTASYVTASNIVGTVTSASYAATASLAPNYVLNSATSSFVQNSQTSSFAITGSNVFNGNQTITGSLTITGSTTVTGSIASTLGVLTPSITGSTASGGTLTLLSTTNATKGKILFGTSGYDEVNNRLGIGTASPAVTLDVSGIANISSQAIIGASLNNGYTLDVSGSGASGSVRIAPVFTATSVSQSAILITGSIRQIQTASAQVYAVNISPTMIFTTGSQTNTVLRVYPTFSGSAALTSSQSNIIADFGAVGVGTQFRVTDITSGSIYTVSDVSGLPIIEATSDWTVNLYNYPTKVFQKTGSAIIVSGSLNISGSIFVGGKQAVNGPTFRVNANSVTTSLATGVSTIIKFDTVLWDSGSVSGSNFNMTNANASINGYTVGPYSFSPSVAGYYQVSAEFSFGSMGASTGTIISSLYKNGSEYCRGTRTPCNVGGGGGHVSTTIYFNGAGDYVHFQGIQASGNTESTEANSSFGAWFTATMIRGA